ncbi:MAG: BON domain-containing protein [Acidobacteriota bacterium]|nr:BON domain-containing protein [Acidobacteriota bacterium]
MPNRYDRDYDERSRGEFSGGPLDRGGLGGYYARDPHRGGFGDDYARDGGWSGGGDAQQYAREAYAPRPSYRGRGPKNWRPSDERIRDTVNELLTDHDGIDATDVEVTVENGEVTLNGMVGSRWEKRLADDIAHSVRGVNDVHNRLRIAEREAQVGKASE